MGVERVLTQQWVDSVFANLKAKVKRLTAHVNRNEIEFSKTLNSMTPADHKVLAWQLYKEMMNVIQAVEEAR